MFFKQLTQRTEFLNANILMFVAIFAFFQIDFCHLSVNICRTAHGSRDIKFKYSTYVLSSQSLTLPLSLSFFIFTSNSEISGFCKIGSNKELIKSFPQSFSRLMCPCAGFS
jgi:hypothetical protein